MLRDDALLERVESDWRAAGLEPERTVMLDYVEKLTLAPASVERSDVEALIAAGFTDADVLGICETAAYYAYANRIADGLGIELEGPAAPEE